MAGKRSIFEEVGQSGPSGTGAGKGKTPASSKGLIDASPKGARAAIRLWMVLLFVLVAAMILIGGMTRLTDSGLSITEWNLVTGALPPLNEAAWLIEFEKYKNFPEFQIQNRMMTLEEFKPIYWWEWAHRFLGRFVGLVWAVGFLWFYLRKEIPNGWTGRLLLLGALGGLQGAVGWWMVHSGLQGVRVDVVSYRLATHLGLAFAILGFLAWYVLALGRSEAALMTARRGREAKLFSMTTGLMHFTMLQIVLGALVAGIDAGRAFPTWPLMGDSFLPPDPFYVPVTGADGQLTVLPWYWAFLENAGLVQFIHRMSGYLLMAFGVVVWLRGRRSPHGTTRFAYHMVMAMMVAQMALGVFTVLLEAHIHVAITHQLGAMLLFVLILRARHLAQYPVAGSVREGTQ
ncbi:COX15/CtaA family protein [Xinfangfangia sp. CPCC 101601]|uniref:Heme A synthase n=1 Tax=Pseudogemmobacter lacusdianii TaxID=3069608 RepID=A0ABU0W2C0_9RHOB|nr:heme A synthase [Xinfangfangia sp. CPCC 101601]MDQ2068169.1 COX15/CtaA family protein [Xinfangfangia sp. CPCC 101601]